MKISQIVLMSVALVACGVETEPKPNFDAGGDSGGSGGSAATSGSGGSGGVSGTGGVGGDELDAGEDSGVDSGFDAGEDSGVDSGVDAAPPLPCGMSCGGDTPHCEETSMTCVACLNSSHCGDDVCDTATHECVTCTATEGCTSPEVCDVANRACVECTSMAGCTLPEVCADDGNTCVECNVDDHCVGNDVCKTDAHACVECNQTTDCDSSELCKLTTNTCVQCLADNDCNSAGAAKCNLTTNTCVPCTDNANCAGVMDGATALGVCDSGSCVQCTASDYDQCGSGNLGRPRVCNATTKRCGGTGQTAGSAGLCQSCVASAQCEDGQSCVEQTFEGETVGSFCFWRISASQGPNGSCLSVPPYARGLANETSAEGTMVNVCGLRNTTCPGLNHFSNPMVQCAPGGVPNHDLCGFSYEGEGTAGNDRDAYCEQVPNDTAYRCTVPCLSSDDCRPGSSCNTGDTPVTCGL